MFLMILSTMAFGVKLAMEPQNKVHIGASVIGGSYGGTIGLDSRLTQLIYVDIGGFASFNTIETPVFDKDKPKEWIIPRHGIYTMPGWRIPHRYNENSINWDLFIRMGFGCVFAEDLSTEDINYIDPALLAGTDFLLRYKDAGLKFTLKEMYFKPYVFELREEVVFFQPHFTAEVFVQF